MFKTCGSVCGYILLFFMIPCLMYNLWTRGLTKTQGMVMLAAIFPARYFLGHKFSTILKKIPLPMVSFRFCARFPEVNIDEVYCMYYYD